MPTNSKDLELSNAPIPGVSNSASSSVAPRPARGFEPHVDRYANPTDARSIAGSGHQGFGRQGNGPEASHGMDRGAFASRTKLTSKP